ncbi:VOC family protein [Sagittula stellata]|uniref:Glyoxalase family protein n=1 Tax=Sagittula stellata (strain ATCC 700073 / DSM 11524 / E-37) TaxID=388399 RepID=A3JYP1_SAGS3|nr:VOC family protein [Sagittula stellata]EBA09594.1 glyoxalase family protein [Sagittula stellata E-37]
MARLEHVNVTVSDAEATAALLGDLLGWRVRWKGPAIHDGTSIHVGDDETYLALYSPKRIDAPHDDNYTRAGSMNHIGLVVDDLDATEAKVREMGFNPHNHADYEPGRRFYFDGPDGVEYEMVSYA